MEGGLTEEISKIEKAQERLRERKRRFLSSKKSALGSMVISSGLDKLETDAILGALMEAAERSKDRDVVERWKTLSKGTKESSRSEKTVAVSFPDGVVPEKEKKELRKLGFVWNRYRREFYGSCAQEAIEKILSGSQAKIEIIQT